MGMCGVGKFQKLWKLRETDACPRCGQLETAAHVRLCKAPAVKPVWEHSINKLHTALRKLDTDPDILQAIITYLTSWRNEQFLHTIREDKLSKLMALRDNIGTKQFFEGWIHLEWERAQHHYYTAIKSQRSGK
jgi:hypothetical protein